MVHRWITTISVSAKLKIGLAARFATLFLTYPRHDDREYYSYWIHVWQYHCWRWKCQFPFHIDYRFGNMGDFDQGNILPSRFQPKHIRSIQLHHFHLHHLFHIGKRYLVDIWMQKTLHPIMPWSKNLFTSEKLPNLYWKRTNRGN